MENNLIVGPSVSDIQKKDGLGSTQTILRISFWLEEDGR